MDARFSLGTLVWGTVLLRVAQAGLQIVERGRSVDLVRCELAYKNYGIQNVTIRNGTLVKRLTDENLCAPDADPLTYYGGHAFYVDSIDGICGMYKRETDGDWRKLHEYVDEHANPRARFIFNPNPDWQFYHINFGKTKDLSFAIVHCTCPAGECNFEEDAFIIGELSPTPGKLARIQDTKVYFFLFRFLFPFGYLLTSLTATLFLFTTLYRLKNTYRDAPLLKAIVHHKGGRTSVIVTLLAVEAVSCMILAIILHLGCLYCSVSSLTEDILSFLAPQLLFCSISTTLLAGSFWFDRRRALERRANLQGEADERPFFVRKRKLFRNFACCALILDGICGTLVMWAVPYFQFIVGGLGAIVPVAVSIIFLMEARNFYAMVGAIKAGMNGRVNTKAGGLARMLSISRWFVFSSFFMLIFGLNALFFAIAHRKIFSADLWVPFWTVFYSSRILMSFTQVMLGKPEKISKQVIASDTNFGASESSVGTNTGAHTVVETTTPA